MTMRKTIIEFDVNAARLVGKIPAWHRKWFHVLGLITMPMVWCGVLAFLLATKIIPHTVWSQTLIVICLIPVGALLKYIFKRNRPPTIYANHMKIKTSSFPSSHAYASMLALGYLAYLVSGVVWWPVAFLFALIILTIGISRVHLGAHYPSDVLGGWIIALCVLLMIIVFV